MSIVKGTHTTSKLRGSAMPRSNAQRHRAINISRLRSSQPFLESAVSKHLVPTGLVVLAFGVAFVCAISDSHVWALAITETNTRVRPELFKIQTRQSEPFSAAVSVMPPPRDEFAAARAARKQWPLTLRRLSCSGVREFCQPDLHNLSYEFAVRHAETVSAIEQLQHEIRSRAPHENERRWLHYLSSTFACRRGDDNSCGIERACYLLSMPRPTSEVRRPEHFFLRSVPRTWS